MAFGTAILIVIAGVLLKYSEIDFRKNAVKATAVITGFDKYGYPVLTYNVDGKKYSVHSRSILPNAKSGTQVEIEYNKNKPTNIEVGENPLYKSSVWMMLFGIIGATITGFLFCKRPGGTSTKGMKEIQGRKR